MNSVNSKWTPRAGTLTEVLWLTDEDVKQILGARDPKPKGSTIIKQEKPMLQPHEQEQDTCPAEGRPHTRLESVFSQLQSELLSAWQAAHDLKDGLRPFRNGELVSGEESGDKAEEQDTQYYVNVSDSQTIKDIVNATRSIESLRDYLQKIHASVVA